MNTIFNNNTTTTNNNNNNNNSVAIMGYFSAWGGKF
jgi:hypothetical protein